MRPPILGSFALILVVLDDDPLPRGVAGKVTLCFAFCVPRNPPVDIPGDILDDIPDVFSGVRTVGFFIPSIALTVLSVLILREAAFLP